MDHAQLSGWICLKNRPLSVNICGGESTDVLLMKRSIHTVHNPLKTGDNQTVTFQLTFNVPISSNLLTLWVTPDIVALELNQFLTSLRAWYRRNTFSRFIRKS